MLTSARDGAILASRYNLTETTKMKLGQSIAWTTTDELGMPATYEGTITMYHKGNVSFYVTNVGTFTVPDTDGHFEVINPIQSNAVTQLITPVTISPDVVNKPVKTSSTPRKSDLVRERIKEAKEKNEEPSVVVKWAVDNLGMTKALASSYVKNNWGKV